MVELKEPRWKTILCWGAVVLYLTIPVFTYGLIIVSIESPQLHINEHLGDFKGLAVWFQALTALIFGLAGLNTWDRTTTQKYNGKKTLFESSEEPPKK